MKISSSLFALGAFALVFTPARASAQEPVTPKKPAPQLTTDDVVKGRPAVLVETDPSADATANWARRVITGTGLSLELPGNPMEIEIPLPEGLRTASTDVRMYGYTDGSWALVIAYLSGPTPAPDPQGLVAGLIQGFTSAPGISEMRYSVETGSNGATIKGTFRRKGVPMVLEGFLLTSRNRAWIGVNQYEEVDKASALISRRMLASVQIAR